MEVRNKSWGSKRHLMSKESSSTLKKYSVNTDEKLSNANLVVIGLRTFLKLNYHGIIQSCHIAGLLIRRRIYFPQHVWISTLTSATDKYIYPTGLSPVVRVIDGLSISFFSKYFMYSNKTYKVANFINEYAHIDKNGNNTSVEEGAMCLQNY